MMRTFRKRREAGLSRGPRGRRVDEGPSPLSRQEKRGVLGRERALKPAVRAGFAGAGEAPRSGWP